MSKKRKRHNRAIRRTYIDFEQGNLKPEDVVAIYHEEGGVVKRIDMDHPSEDDVWKSLTIVDSKSWHDNLEPFDLGTEIHRQIEQHTIIMGGDILGGSVHTNTDPKLTAELSAWWQQRWYEAMMDACYGRVRKPLDKPDEPHYTGLIVKDTP